MFIVSTVPLVRRYLVTELAEARFLIVKEDGEAECSVLLQG